MDIYDLAVLGSGPAGHSGAIEAAKLGKRVVIVEQHDRVGGVSATSGTLPSKALRDAALHLTSLRQRIVDGGNFVAKDALTVQDLIAGTAQVVRHETSAIEAQLRRYRVRILRGKGRFDGPHHLEVEAQQGKVRLEAQSILIATGTRPAHPPDVAFDGRKVIDSSQILNLPSLPRRLAVVGAGVIGIEYACIYAALGSEVVLIDRREELLEFVDRQIVATLLDHLRRHDVEFYLGDEVVGLRIDGRDVVVFTQGGREIHADCALYSTGRQANTDQINLQSTGLPANARGRIEVDEHYRTMVPHIYAAGDVVGFPALAATSREQGKAAARHAFGVSIDAMPGKVPYGIYAIPEISMVGPTEQELRIQGVPYEVGVAKYEDTARGQLIGDQAGLVKLLFDRNTLKLLAVHIVGEGATELIHIGQAVEAMGGTLHYFVNAVFNYPTLAECYKLAALDGISRVGAVGEVSTGG